MQSLKPHLSQSPYPSKYQILFCDESVDFPFVVNAELLQRAQILKERHEHPKSLAYALFTYLSTKLQYGDTKRQLGYASGLETWQNKQGVCGEMSFLYISLSRYCALKSTYVSVTKDHKGKKVCHGCAGVYIPQITLVDLAYRQFNVKHRSFQIRSDNSIFQQYMRWKYGHSVSK